jgi:hypothetical protein
MKETNYLISLQHLPFIHLCHSDLFPSQMTELKVIGLMSDPNSTSPDILSDGPVKDILGLHISKVRHQSSSFSKTAMTLERSSD